MFRPVSQFDTIDFAIPVGTQELRIVADANVLQFRTADDLPG